MLALVKRGNSKSSRSAPPPELADATLGLNHAQDPEKEPQWWFCGAAG